MPHPSHSSDFITWIIFGEENQAALYIIMSLRQCSKIRLLWLAWDQTFANLLNIPDYQTVLYWPKFLQVIFCYCFYNWAVQLSRGVFHLDISFICWFRVIRVLYVQWRIHSWRSCSRRQGMSTVVDIQMHSDLFERIPAISFTHEALFW